MSRCLRSLHEDKEMMQSTLNKSRMKNAKLFDEISELNRDLLSYKKRLERAYRPIDLSYSRKPQARVYDSYSVSAPTYSEIPYRTPVYEVSTPTYSAVPYRGPVYGVATSSYSEIPYRAPIYGLYDDPWEVRRTPVTADPVVQKTFRTQDGVVHRIYTVKSAV